MNHVSRQVLVWAPRFLTLLFAFFLGISALDVFSEAHSLRETKTALAMHLVPTLLLLGLLGVAWRREWIAAAGLTALAVFYVVSTWGRFPFVTYLTIAGPLVGLGVLYSLSWRQRRATAESGPGAGGAE